MLIENKSSSYPEIKTRKRELCALYNQLAIIKNQNHPFNKVMKTQSINYFLTIILTLITTSVVCSQNLEINLCDEDGDGYSDFSIEEIEKFVLQNVGLKNDYYKEQVLVSTYFSDIQSIDNPSTNPTLSTLCDLSSSAFTDIAINSNKEIFICPSITAISETCDVSYINYKYDLWGVNAMSFDDLDNMYVGFGTESYVTRVVIDGNQAINHQMWHDFEIGASGGDFVLLNDKMYISWQLSNDNFRLYEITVNEKRDYISHIDLGKLPNKTFGLASELGTLYGVTPNKLFKINFSDFTFIDVIENPDPENEWYGATGLHEAITFNMSTHLTIQQAEQNTDALSGTWTNTLPNKQSLYVRIENSLTGEYDIFTIDINISAYPNVNQPINLKMCYENTYNIFDLTQISSQMQIDNINNLSFTYYNIDPEINPTVNQVSTQYQSTQNIETLFVRVEKDNSDCNLIYNFQIINNDVPNLLPLSNIQSPTLLETCYFDENNIGYFNLKDIENNIILANGTFDISYHLSYLDAELGNNQMSYIYYLEDSIKEVFIKVTDEKGCSAISNFYLELNCFTNNESLANIEFPLFFTPNNDGINDFWNIEGVSEKVKKESTITIYNRYGKALFTFRPYSNIGWNGTYNGKQLPSSDYWFTFTTNYGLKKIGHFSLKR